MDTFSHLIANKTSAQKTIKVRKVYVNEDPNVEETAPCPSCWEQNQFNTVRYMYLNLHEAIYKCEGASCMFPFRNFKFKNYTEKRIYYYEPIATETPSVLPDISTTHTNATFPASVDNVQQQNDAGESMDMEYNFDFSSPERNSSVPKTSSADNVDGNIFDSPSLSFGSLVQDIDTDFIDDLLKDLHHASPEKKLDFKSPVRSTPQVESVKCNRQLKRCLKMLERKSSDESIGEGVFKVPSLPASTELMHKAKKSHQRSHKHARPNIVPMTPVEFIQTYDNQSLSIPMNNASSSTESGIKPLKNQNVERMLSFIERSMKNREPKQESTTEQSNPQPNQIAKQPLKKRKQSKKMSLSQTVLLNSLVDYSASESEQEDAPEPVVDHVEQPEPILPEPLCAAQTTEVPSLPPFEDLMKHIYPVQHEGHTTTTTLSSRNGFRSAGSSPTRIQHWEQTTPKRNRSLESLCSLLE